MVYKSAKGVFIIDTLTFVIINRGKANMTLKRAKEIGATGGTIILGEGTVQSKLFNLLGLTETHKEILMIHGSNEFSILFHKFLTNNLLFYKRNKGIAFTIPFLRWNEQTKKEHIRTSYSSIQASHACIMAVVDKECSIEVMAAARSAKAYGGTIVHGRGLGVPGDTIFPIMIEPEKEIVIIVTEVAMSHGIRRGITHVLELDQQGTGIVFSLPVIKVSGLYEERKIEKQEVKE